MSEKEYSLDDAKNTASIIKKDFDSYIQPENTDRACVLLLDENERLSGFCKEFVYGEDNPQYYKTMDEKIAELNQEIDDSDDMYLARIHKLEQEIEQLKNGMREIYEVWAGSEGLVDTTASEAYQMHLIEEMRDIAQLYMSEQLKAQAMPEEPDYDLFMAFNKAIGAGEYNPIVNADDFFKGWEAIRTSLQTKG